MKKLIAIALVGAALAAGIATSVYRNEQPPAKPVVSAAPAPAAAARTQPLSKPQFSLADAQGVQRSITEWDGKALVVNFWATWCAPCRREMPLLREMQDLHTANDIQIIGVAVDFRDDVLKYLEAAPVNYPVLIGEQDAIDAAEGFGVEFMGLPFTAFTDHQGQILHVHIGEIHRPQAELIFDTVNRLRAGEMDLGAARRIIAHGMAGVSGSAALQH